MSTFLTDAEWQGWDSGGLGFRGSALQEGPTRPRQRAVPPYAPPYATHMANHMPPHICTCFHAIFEDPEKLGCHRFRERRPATWDAVDGMQWVQRG